MGAYPCIGRCACAGSIFKAYLKILRSRQLRKESLPTLVPGEGHVGQGCVVVKMSQRSGHDILLRANLNGPYDLNRQSPARRSKSRMARARSNSHRGNNQHAKENLVRLTSAGLRVNSMFDPTFVPSDEAVRLLKLQGSAGAQIKAIKDSAEPRVTHSITSLALSHEQIDTTNITPKPVSPTVKCTATSLTPAVAVQPDHKHQSSSTPQPSSDAEQTPDSQMYRQQQDVQVWLQHLDLSLHGTTSANSSIQGYSSDGGSGGGLALSELASFQRAVAFHRTVCILCNCSRFVIPSGCVKSQNAKC